MKEKRHEPCRELTLWMAERLKVRSEKKFAVAFLSYFGSKIPLTHHPKPVVVEDMGAYEPDFCTRWGKEDTLFYEVTDYEETYGVSKKQRQFVVMKSYLNYYPRSGYLEVKGGAIRHLEETMTILEQVYEYELVLPKAQRLINELGRADVVIASAWLNSFAKS